ncbi:MAG: hypothetical protein H7210_08955 [Pyrinomonadaceae bacterium]|nr:hypothetical protein [Phycisphaerales bacterium]
MPLHSGGRAAGEDLLFEVDLLVGIEHMMDDARLRSTDASISAPTLGFGRSRESIHPIASSGVIGMSKPHPAWNRRRSA